MSEKPLVISYLSLRKSVGYLGFLLPFVLAFGKMLLESPGILSSISGYYYSVMGNVLVGTLCAIGVFLLSYHGYGRADDTAGDIAGISAIGIALFPVAPNGSNIMQEILIGRWHMFFATVFFLTLAYFALVLFRKTNPKSTPTPEKKIRNVMYAMCGSIILFCIACMAFLSFFPHMQWIQSLPHPVFWLESLAVGAFGISWLIKGEAILQDQ